MSMVIWNVRGFNKESRRQDVLNHIQHHSPSLVALVETKVKIENLPRLSNCVPLSWKSCHNLYLSTKEGYGFHGILKYGIVWSMLVQFNKH